MTYFIAIAIWISIFAVIFTITRPKNVPLEWRYVIREEKNTSPNVDNGYWVIIGPAGQKLKFTDDALKAAHRRHLSHVRDKVSFIDSNFKAKKK